MGETIKSAFSQFKNNKLRTFLTMLGMFIGIGAVIIILSIGEGVKAYFNDQFASIGRGTIEIKAIQYGKDDMITQEDLEMLKQIPEVKTVMNFHDGYYATARDYKKNIKDAMIFGMMHNLDEIQPFKILAGRTVSEADIRLQNNVIIVDENFSRVMYNRKNPKYALGKSVELNISGEPQSFEVIGIIKSNVPAFMPIDMIPLIIYMPFTTVDRLAVYGDGRSYTGYVVIDDAHNPADFTYPIQRILEKRHGKKNAFSVSTLTSQIDQINNILNTLNIFVSLVAAVSLLVGGIGIMNIMLVTVRERTREIGIRKALGATDKQILSQFLIEALILTVAGGIIGMLIGYIGGLLISNLISVAAKTVISAKMTTGMVVFSVGISSFVGLVFGVYPAYKAAKLDPIEALRFE